MKPGYKQTEVGVIPEEWEATTVGAMIADGIIEKPLDGNHGNIHPKSGDFVDWGIPFVMANNVQDGQVDLVNCSFIRKQQADSLQKGFSITGDVLLTHKATIGNTAVVGELGVPYIMLTPQVTYYRVKDETRLSNLYLRHYFDTAGFQAVLRGLAGGGTRSYIGISAQHQLPVNLPPSLREQRAIATALSDVDGLLGGLDRLIAKKRDLKQAAMQQLLTGQTRLPGFRGEWVVQSISQLGSIQTGPFGTLLKANEYSGSEGVPLISVGEVGAGQLRVTGHTPLVPPQVVRRLPQYVLRQGDIVFGRKGAVDRSALVSETQDGWFLGSDGIRLRPGKGSYSPYLAWQFQRHEVQAWLRQNAIGTTMASLNQRVLNRVQIPIASLPEQTAIASVLSEMDGELAVLEQRREKTRALKQAMMQELLTGRTRLV